MSDFQKSRPYFDIHIHMWIIRLANVWQDQAEEALLLGGGWGGAGGEDESATQRAFQNREGGKEGAGRRERTWSHDDNKAWQLAL